VLLIVRLHTVSHLALLTKFETTGYLLLEPYSETAPVDSTQNFTVVRRLSLDKNMSSILTSAFEMLVEIVCHFLN